MAAFPDPVPELEEEPLPDKVPHVIKVRADMSGVLRRFREDHVTRALTYDDMLKKGLHHYPPALVAKIKIKEEREKRRRKKR